MAKKKIEWKMPALIWGGWLVLLVIAKAISSNDNYKAVYTAAEDTAVGSDGRAAVGGQAGYTVWASGHAAHELMSPGAKFCAVLAWIFFFAAGAYLLCMANDIILFAAGSKAAGQILFVIMGIGMILSFAGYSSIVADTYINLSVEEWESVKNDKEAILRLFKLKA